MARRDHPDAGAAGGAARPAGRPRRPRAALHPERGRARGDRPPPPRPEPARLRAAALRLSLPRPAAAARRSASRHRSSPSSPSRSASRRTRSAATPSARTPGTSTPPPCRTPSATGRSKGPPGARSRPGSSAPPSRPERAASWPPALRDELRRRKVIVPAVTTSSGSCAAALTRGERMVLARLTEGLDRERSARLDRLLDAGPDAARTWLGWLRQRRGPASAASFHATVERLRRVREVGIEAERATPHPASSPGPAGAGGRAALAQPPARPLRRAPARDPGGDHARARAAPDRRRRSTLHDKLVGRMFRACRAAAAREPGRGPARDRPGPAAARGGRARSWSRPGPTAATGSPRSRARSGGTASRPRSMMPEP